MQKQIRVVGHFDEWQLIFYGTNSSAVNLLETPRRHSDPNVTVSTTAASTSDISTSTVAPAIDNITSSNVNLTFSGDVSTRTVADDGVTTAKPITDQLTVTSNFSIVGTISSSSSNVSVVKNLTAKGSDAENSTQLKSGVSINGTLVTLPPAVIHGYVSNATSSSDENRTSTFSGSDVTATTAAVDSLVSTAQNVSVVVFESENVTGSERTYENATTLNVTVSSVNVSADNVSMVSDSFINVTVVPDAVAVNATVSLLDTETAEYNASSEYTVTPTAAETSVPVLLFGEVQYNIAFYYYYYYYYYLFIYLTIVKTMVKKNSEKLKK